jgi:AcrR family transcriptional regulator
MLHASISDPLDRRDGEEAKRQRILDAAMRLVLSYGYHRTTMDDVARAAEMSRPALYLLFRNKADIYRAIASRMFERCGSEVGRLLDTELSLGARLFSSVEFMIESMCPVLQSPHGAEIMDLRGQLAGDLVEHWHDVLAGRFRAAIEAETAMTGVDLRQRGLCAEVLAELLLDGIEGMKLRTPDIETQRNTARQLVRVIELAIRP